MTIYLHIGTHKTATSSIQQYLYTSRDRLRDHGYFYPDSGRPPKSRPHFGHHLLAWSIRKIKGSPNENCWTSLVREIEESGCHKVIISSEDFERMKPSDIQKVREYLKNHSVRVILYLRDPIEFIYSDYKQLVKTGKYHRPFKQFLNENMNFCNYTQLVQKWSEVFGAENISIRIFDKTKKHPGIITDFLETVGIQSNGSNDLPNTDISRNISPREDAIQLIRRLNKIESALKRSPSLRRVFKRIRKLIIRQKGVGKVLLITFSPLLNPRPISEKDLRAARARINDWNRDLIPHLSDEDLSYLTP